MDNAKQRQAILMTLYAKRQASADKVKDGKIGIKNRCDTTTVSTFKQASKRLLILRILSDQPGYMANHDLLLFALHNYGYVISQDQLMVELSWLDQTANALKNADYMAILNDKGRDVVESKRAIPGIGALMSQESGYPDGDVKSDWVTKADLKAAHGDVDFALDILEELGYIKTNRPPLNYLGCRCRVSYRITGQGVLAYEAMQ